MNLNYLAINNISLQFLDQIPKWTLFQLQLALIFNQKKAYAAEPDVFDANMIVIVLSGGKANVDTPPPPVPV